MYEAAGIPIAALRELLVGRRCPEVRARAHLFSTGSVRCAWSWLANLVGACARERGKQERLRQRAASTHGATIVAPFLADKRGVEYAMPSLKNACANTTRLPRATATVAKVSATR